MLNKWISVRASVGDSVETSIWTSVYDSVWKSVSTSVYCSANDDVRHAVTNKLKTYDFTTKNK